MGINSIKHLDVRNCKAHIYDALGNVTAKEIPVYGSSDDQQFYFFWDGRNQNQRFVGSGTYLAVIEIKELGDQTVNIQKEKIGVRR